VLAGYGRQRTLTRVSPVTTASKKALAVIPASARSLNSAALVSIAIPRITSPEVGVFAETTPRRKARSDGEASSTSSRVAFRPAPSRVG